THTDASDGDVQLLNTTEDMTINVINEEAPLTGPDQGRADLLDNLKGKIDNSKMFKINVTRQDLLQRGLTRGARQNQASPRTPPSSPSVERMVSIRGSEGSIPHWDVSPLRLAPFVKCQWPVANVVATYSEQVAAHLPSSTTWLVDTSHYNAYVLWTSMEPSWQQQQKPYRRRREKRWDRKSRRQFLFCMDRGFEAPAAHVGASHARTTNEKPEARQSSGRAICHTHISL
ncbi:hypothetical protein KUCAC02_007048, partial [Chaenocephalus aceratus]